MNVYQLEGIIRGRRGFPSHAKHYLLLETDLGHKYEIEIWDHPTNTPAHNQRAQFLVSETKQTKTSQLGALKRLLAIDFKILH